MAKAPKFGSDADFAKHVGQPAQIAHQGKDSFFVKGGFITYSAGPGDAGKPIKLGADGLLDTSLLTSVAHAASHEVGGSDLVNHDDLTGFVGNEHINWTAATSNLSTTGYVQATTGDLVRLQHGSPTYGVGVAAAGSGGWARGYAFINNAYTARLSQFGALGNLDDITYLFIGTEYNKETVRIYTTGLVGGAVYLNPALTSGNPEFRWYGWDSGASARRYGKVYVDTVGATILAGEEYVKLLALTGFIDLLPTDANYGMVLRKHDSGVGGGNPYANFFVEDAAIDYLNIVITQAGGTLGLVIDDNENVGVNKVATAGYRLDVNGVIRGSRLYSSVTTGVSPIVVASTTKVASLHADILDGYHSSAFPQLVYKSTPGAFNITTGGVWYDADLTSLTSANATWVYLHLHVYTTADTHEARLVVAPYNADLVWAECRVYGGSRIAYDAHGSGNATMTYNDTCVWVPLASGQLMSYYATRSGSGFIGSSTAHFDVIAYIEEK